MKLGLVLGYWGAPTARTHRGARTGGRAARLRLGLDARRRGARTRSRRSRGSARTRRTIKLGTGVVQISARTPAATAMHALTLDHLSNGRLILGLGVSGPQVVEGWYGQPFGKPLARTREYVEIIRQVLRARGAGRVPGRALPAAVPRSGRARARQAAASRSRTRCARMCRSSSAPRDRRTSRSTAEIADGWLPLYYSPFRPEVYADSLAAAKPGFEIASLCNCHRDRRRRGAR